MKLEIILYYHDESGQDREIRMHPEIRDAAILQAIGVYVDGQAVVETPFISGRYQRENFAPNFAVERSIAEHD